MRFKQTLLRVVNHYVEKQELFWEQGLSAFQRGDESAEYLKDKMWAIQEEDPGQKNQIWLLVKDMSEDLACCSPDISFCWYIVVETASTSK